MDEPKQFGAIAAGFITNINALRIFNSQIGQLARQHDVETSEQHKKDLAEVFGLTLEEMEAMVGADEPRETAASQDGKGKTDIVLSVNQPKDSALSEAMHTRIKTQLGENAPKTLVRIIRLCRGLQKQPPIQEHVLRRGALITLASYFEFLISELLHSFYARFPQALPSEDRVLSLSDLREIGSIEEAATFLVSKEIDAILRDSVDNQLQYFTKRPKLDISAIEPYKKHLSEL